MITKIIPRELHGTFFGVQASASNALGGISAILSGLILEKLPSPINFALCFLLAGISLGISYLFIAQTREEEAAPRPIQPEVDFWAEARRILRQDRNFVTFLGVRALSQFASMAFAFYLIYAVRHFGMGAGLAGLMTGVLLIAQVVAGPVMGRLGDAWSHRGVMFIGALAAALSALLAWRATSLNWFYPVFLLEAVAITAIWIVPLAMTVSFAKHEQDRPLYIGLSSSLTAPWTILAPILGGWIADAAGFDMTFLVSAGWALLMAAALAFLVKEPHHHLPEPLS
jgi:MFS family permease